MKKQYVVMFLMTFIVSFNSYAQTNQGLWIGQIELNKVNEAVSKTDTQTPTSVKHPFDMKILLHVDDTGKVCLLKDVTLMQKVENNTARRLLITDDTRLSEYEGVVRRDGKLVGIRMGSPAFEFDLDKNSLELSGSMGAGQSLEGTLILDGDHPMNPFRHMYHPDHKNGIAIERNMQMTFDEDQGSDDPENAKFQLNGTYKETITGLHKIPLKVEGRFNIQRISEIGKLNE